MTLWSTPDKPIDIVWACRTFTIPFHLLDKVLGAMGALLYEQNWTQDGTETVEDAVEYCDNMMLNLRRCNLIGQLITGQWSETPPGTLNANGQIFNRVDYPLLYAVTDPNLIIDADTAYVIDARNRSIRGKKPTTNTGEQIGADGNFIELRHVPPHAHSSKQYSTNIDLEGAGVPDPLSVGLPVLPDTTGSAGSGDKFWTIPRHVVVKAVVVAE